MASKVLYFTAGPKASAPELAEIALLNAAAAAPFEVGVRNGLESSSYGYGVEDADYVAGTIPDLYDDAETYPIFDPAEPPIPVQSDQTVLNTGDVLTMASGKGTVVATIAAGVATYAFTEAATKELISHGDTLTLEAAAGTVTVAIVAGVPTYTFVGP